MGKNIALVGCGKMGFPLAHYCITLGDIDEITLEDIDPLQMDILENKIKKIHKNVVVYKGITSKKFDFIVLALSGKDTKVFILDFINSNNFKKNQIVISLGRPNYDNEADHDEFNKHIKKWGLSLLYGFGLEPGLVEVIVKRTIKKYDSEKISEINAFCGGIPKRAKAPLFYTLLFGDKLPSANRRALYKRDNQVMHCSRFDRHESIFIERIGLLEAYHDGMSPYFVNSPEVSSIPNFSQQTVRWPGFAQSLRILHKCGLLSETLIPGYQVTASDTTHAVLKQNNLINDNVPDLTVLHVSLHFSDNAHNQSDYSISLISHYDEVLELSGMAKLTAFLPAFLIKYLGKSNIFLSDGITLSHEIFNSKEADDLIAMLKIRGICDIFES